jgi:hypothetical protein
LNGGLPGLAGSPGYGVFMDSKITDRSTEWFVPRFGSARFRTLIGLLFLPYTGMVLSFAVIGSMLAKPVYWDRVLAIVIIYFLGLGIAAHALDAVGSRQKKPWGNMFTRRRLWLAAGTSLAAAYAIAAYYMIVHVPLLWIIAVLEGFFVFAYNLEWFNGKFHTDAWFVFSWGFLPVLGGSVMQTNRITLPALCLAAAMALFSRVEIKVSRPYKQLKQDPLPSSETTLRQLRQYEAILKSISTGVILLGAGWMIWRLQA